MGLQQGSFKDHMHAELSGRAVARNPSSIAQSDCIREKQEQQCPPSAQLIAGRWERRRKAPRACPVMHAAI